MRVAAIDVGSNSIRLLIADVEGVTGKLKPLLSDLITTRLGKGIVAGHLQPDIMKATVEVIELFYRRAREWGTEKIGVFATSAVRDAINQAMFLNMVKEKTGISVQVLRGEEEAELSYRGALLGLPVRKPPVVVDIGGGSTELVWEEKGRLKACSIRLGAVRLLEELQQLWAQPEDNWLLALGLVKERLREVAVLWEIRGNTQAFELIGVGGTVTTAAAMHKQLTVYEPEKVHGIVLTRYEIEQLLRLVCRLSLADRKNLPGLQPARADIIPAGLTILLALLQVLAQEKIVVSEWDLLHAYAWRLAMSN